MEGQAQGWQGNIRSLLERMTLTQRIIAAAAIVIVIAGGIYAAIGIQQPDYATLFSGLDEQDAGAVVEQLKAAKIPYRLVQGGAVIQVPSRQVYDVRLDMAQQGLPKGKTVGFEMFDGGQLGNLGMTDFMQRVNYQRALEGELARTIASLDPIAAARVHIVIPEPSLFKEDERVPTASVVLQLKARAEVSREQVNAITNLVASSVEGLKPSNITLVDMAGNVLSTAGEADSVPSALQGSTGALEMQRNYERDLERRMQAVLDQSVGVNRAVVQVSAAFDWDQKQVNSETYATSGAGDGLVRSEQVQEEIVQGSGTTAGGVPGVDSNTQNQGQTPTYPSATTGTDPNSTVTKRNTTRNYELSKVTQTVTQAPGSLQRMTVAVLLDENVPQDQADRLQTMLTAAAGLDTSRGDTISVQRVAFANQSDLTSQPGAMAALDRQSLYVTIAKAVALLLAFLLLLRFARLTFRELSQRVLGDYTPYVTIVDDELSLPPSVQQLPAATTTGAPALDRPQLPEMLPEPVDTPMRKQIAGVAERRPELIAELLQSWLAENR